MRTKSGYLVIAPVTLSLMITPRCVQKNLFISLTVPPLVCLHLQYTVRKSCCLASSSIIIIWNDRWNSTYSSRL